MKSKYNFFQTGTAALLLITAGALSLGLAGCGGSSSQPYSYTGGAGQPQLTNVTVTGIVKDTSGNALVGYTVYYDMGTVSQVSGVTTNTGSFSLNIPVSAITGSDTLTFYSASDELAGTQAVTVSKTQTTTTVTSTVTPPPPPSNGI